MLARPPSFFLSSLVYLFFYPPSLTSSRLLLSLSVSRLPLAMWRRVRWGQRTGREIQAVLGPPLREEAASGAGVALCLLALRCPLLSLPRCLAGGRGSWCGPGMQVMEVLGEQVLPGPQVPLTRPLSTRGEASMVPTSAVPPSSHTSALGPKTDTGVARAQRALWGGAGCRLPPACALLLPEVPKGRTSTLSSPCGSCASCGPSRPSSGCLSSR